MEGNDFSPCATRDLALKTVDVRTAPWPADTWLRRASIAKPCGFIGSWTCDNCISETRAQIASGNYCFSCHPKMCQSDDEYMEHIIRRDWMRKDAYTDMRLGFASFIHPRLLQSRDKKHDPVMLLPCVLPSVLNRPGRSWM